MSVHKNMSASESEFSGHDETDDDDYAGSASEPETEERAEVSGSNRTSRHKKQKLSDANDGDDAGSASKEEDQITRSSRLSRYKNQKISEKKSHGRLVAASKKEGKDKGKAPAKGRNFGKLAYLKDMSLDILFEITSHLQPLDILQLSRVSKQFHSLFASKGSRHVWVAAKRNLATEMPACPADLSEPQYILLMFEHNCQACDYNRAPKTDYALRVRFCGPCFNENVLKGTKVLKSFPKVPETVFRLVPRSLTKLSCITLSFGYSFNNADNGRNNAYYFPETEAVITRYKELQSDATALAVFVKEHKDTARQMMKDAIILAKWAEDNRANKAQQGTENMMSRKADIEAKLVELGWTKEDFPSGIYEWNILLEQPRKLTPLIWKTIRPKLEALLKTQREDNARRQLQVRRELRQAELKSIWDDSLKALGDSSIRTIMPEYLEVCDFPPVEKLLFENDAREPLTQSRWDTIAECLSSGIDTFRTNVLYTLTNTLATPGPGDVVDPNMLGHAAAIFRCSDDPCEDMLPGLEGIQDHHHFKNMRWTDICGRVSGDLDTGPVVQMILKALQLPEESSFEALCAFDGKLVCLCGHPGHRQPNNFVALVSHILAENRWYKQRFGSSNEPQYAQTLTKGRHRYSSAEWEKHDIVLYNDHHPTGESLVGVTSDLDPCTFKVAPVEDGRGTGEVWNQGNKYCKYCFALGELVLLNSTGMLNYHMKAKHRREHVADDDTLSSWDLVPWKLKALRKIDPE